MPSSRATCGTSLRGLGDEAGIPRPAFPAATRPATPSPASPTAPSPWAPTRARVPAFAGEAARRGLPPTPFDRQRHWVAGTAGGRRPRRAARRAPPARLPPRRRGGQWTRHLDTTLEPWLADHRLGGTPVLPAAAMLDMALAAAAACFPEAKALELTGFAIHQALPIEAERARELRSTVGADGHFRLASRRRLSDEPWTLHAEARLAAMPRLPEAGPDMAPSGQRLERPDLLDRAAASASTTARPSRQWRRSPWMPPPASPAPAWSGPPAAPPDGDFLLHPSRLDGALQGLLGLLAEAPAEPGTALVPVRFARVVVRLGAAPPAVACIQVTEAGRAQHRRRHRPAGCRRQCGRRAGRLHPATHPPARQGGSERCHLPGGMAAGPAPRRDRGARTGGAGTTHCRRASPRPKPRPQRSGPAAGRVLCRRRACRARRPARDRALCTPAAGCAGRGRPRHHRAPPGHGRSPPPTCPAPPRSGVRSCWNSRAWRRTSPGPPWPRNSCRRRWPIASPGTPARCHPPGPAGCSAWPRSWRKPPGASPPPGRRAGRCGCWRSVPAPVR